MADKGKPQKFCLTVIPREWPQFTGPAWNGEDVHKARMMWSEHLQTISKIQPTPRIYRYGD